ncbi:hypothetical protein AQUCO_07400021v1 [Aquilegia coerulea]|uniref:Uncharacterized protein n=1 Tax=Aquilegia coerulea TaxID=218851 RepID=A0A2G5C9E6_AQUCA|nr:hypothetical protein AQUCO_07400021v1 [Aquilegia coerulea]
MTTLFFMADTPVLVVQCFFSPILVDLKPLVFTLLSISKFQYQNMFGFLIFNNFIMGHEPCIIFLCDVGVGIADPNIH